MGFEPPKKKPAMREIAVIVASIEDPTQAGSPTVSVTMPAEDASKIIEDSLRLYRELEELKLHDPGFFTRHRPLTLALEAQEESLKAGGVLAAFNSENLDSDEDDED